MDTPLVINIDTGVISFRTAENAVQCNCRPISAKHAKMVQSGEINLKDLLSAIKKHMMSAEGFDYEKYADERRKLNVRHTALVLEDSEKVDDADPSEYINDDEIKSVDVGKSEVESAIDDLVGKPQKKAPAKPKIDGLEGLKGI